MAYSDDQIQSLKDRADIVGLIGKRISLRKMGRDQVGLCPFHGERSPSFYVIPHKHIYHCFGCGETGDVFKFFMKLDGFSFKEAIDSVARESGVIMVDERQDPEEAKRRKHADELTAILERATKFYENKFWRDEGRVARDVVKKRGVSEETAKAWKLGFGGHSREDLAKALAKAGASEAHAIEAGLLIQGRTSPFDRFNGRLIVPIRVPKPPDGRGVALGGRVIEGVTPERPGFKIAKYINSPETPLYHKGEVLFGLDHAREQIRREARAIVVEGYFDVIGVHQAGLPLAVATCGTSLTPQHLELLTRTGAKEIIFLFDGDAAGLKAAQRAAEMCAKAQVPSRVATLPKDVDPDDFARENGLDALRKLVDEGKPSLEYLIVAALSAIGPGAGVEERVRAVQDVRPVVLAAPEGLSRELYIGQIADRLKVSVDAVKATLEEPPQTRSQPRSAPPAVPEDPRASVAPRPPRGRPQPPKEPAVPDPDAGPADDPSLSPEEQRLERLFHVTRRRTFKTEEGIVVLMLRHPPVVDVVAHEGILGVFANDALRQIGERLVAARAEGTPVAATALSGLISDEAARRDFEKQVQADDTPADIAATYVQRLCEKELKFVQEARSKENALRLEHATPEQARALVAEQAQRLELHRNVESRSRDRQRKPGVPVAPSKPPGDGQG